MWAGRKDKVQDVPERYERRGLDWSGEGRRSWSRCTVALSVSHEEAAMDLLACWESELVADGCSRRTHWGKMEKVSKLERQLLRKSDALWASSVDRYQLWCEDIDEATAQRQLPNGLGNGDRASQQGCASPSNRCFAFNATRAHKKTLEFPQFLKVHMQHLSSSWQTDPCSQTHLCNTFFGWRPSPRLRSLRFNAQHNLHALAGQVRIAPSSLTSHRSPRCSSADTHNLNQRNCVDDPKLMYDRTQIIRQCQWKHTTCRRSALLSCLDAAALQWPNEDQQKTPWRSTNNAKTSSLSTGGNICSGRKNIEHQHYPAIEWRQPMKGRWLPMPKTHCFHLEPWWCQGHRSSQVPHSSEQTDWLRGSAENFVLVNLLNVEPPGSGWVGTVQQWWCHISSRWINGSSAQTSSCRGSQTMARLAEVQGVSPGHDRLPHLRGDGHSLVDLSGDSTSCQRICPPKPPWSSKARGRRSPNFAAQFYAPAFPLLGFIEDVLEHFFGLIDCCSSLRFALRETLYILNHMNDEMPKRFTFHLFSVAERNAVVATS